MKKVMARLHRMFKEEKGLTLIELLAVIVILGIIAAIAVPAITGITGNAKKEAHKANAHQMIEAAKQMVAIKGFSKDIIDSTFNGYKLDTSTKAISSTSFKTSSSTNPVMKITLQQLIDGKYFTDIKNPEKDNPYVAKNGGADAGKNVVYVYDDGGNDLYFIKLEDEVGATGYNQWNSPLLESEIDHLVIK